MTESSLVDLGFSVPIFSGDDPFACLNKAMAFLTVVASSRSRGLDGQAVKTIIPNNAAFQTRDLDTYDFDCDDILNAKAVLIANISNYGSDVISKVPHFETYLIDTENQSVLAMQDFEQPPATEITDNEIYSDSNIISLTEDFRKRFTPQQELSGEQAFWLHMSDPTSKRFDALRVRIEAPKELPKISLVNESLKKLKFHIGKFDNAVKIRTTPNAHIEGLKCSTSNCGSKPTVETQKPELKVYNKKPKNVKNIGSSKKAKIVESKNANHSESNHTWGLIATDILSSSSLVMTGYLDCSLVSGLQMFETHDRELLSAHELSSKTKSWLWHRQLSHLNFGTLNKLAEDGLARGILRLKFQKDHMCFACASGKSKKSSHQSKAEHTNQEKLYL
nr:Gag-Pol polyprotein [Tanacetum cinerariifolium]